MPRTCRLYLDTVVTLRGVEQNGRSRWIGTGFFCRAFRSYWPTRELLFLVTNAHVVCQGFEHINVVVPPREGDRAVTYSVTGKIGLGPSKWEVDGHHDLAVLLLDPEHLPEDEIRDRTFQVEADALTIRELRRLRIGEGDEALLVGFAFPQHDPVEDYPAVRLATIVRVPKRASCRRSFLLEGTTFPGNSGSPVIVRPGRDACGDDRADGSGKLIGIIRAGGNAATTIRSDKQGIPVEVREGVGQIHIVPVDVLRRSINVIIGNVLLAETFGPMFRKVRGWMRRSRG